MRFFECLLLLLLLLCSTSISTHFRSRKKMPTNLELRHPQHHFGKAQKPSRAVKGRTTPPTDHFGKAQKPSRAIKGRRDYSAPISAERRRPQHHFGKAQKPSRAVKGRHDYSAPNSAVLTLKRAAEIYGANYAAHSTISERPRNHQGRLKDVTIFRPQIQPNYAAHSTISERPRNHQGRLKDELRHPQHHFGKAQKPSRAVNGRHDFSAPNSAVLTLKRAAEIYGANDAAHSTISERPRNHQGRLKDELRRPQTISERPRNHQGRLKDELRRSQHHFGKAQKPSRAVNGRHDFSAPNSAVLTLKRAAEIYGANYAAHRPVRKGPETIKGGTTPPTDHFGKAQKPSRTVKGRRDFSAPISAVLTLKRASEIYGANYAAHSTISERPRNHQGRLKGVTIFRPQIQPF
ncbi:hypothetical protein YC2023_121918 [Brassica napus]